MRSLTGKPSRRLAAVAVVGALLAAGAAAAATGLVGADGVIHGCVASNGSLSVGSSCKKNETALDWNRVGPQGPAGADGAPGERGPSDAWSASLPKTEFGERFGNGPPYDAAAFTLPAGSYVLNGSIDLQSSSTGTEDLRCDVEIADDKGTRLLVPRTRLILGPFGETLVPLVGAATLSEPAELHVHCGGFGPDGGIASATVQLVATQVATLHEG